jgi:hypothetical protein
MGTPRYCSLNALLGKEISRRDDMESVGYLMVYLLKGWLPWLGLGYTHDGNDTNLLKVKAVKLFCPLEHICAGCPPEFFKIIDHCRKLGFEEEPDYPTIREMIARVALKEQINLFDNIFDWSVKAVTLTKYPSLYDKVVRLQRSSH